MGSDVGASVPTSGDGQKQFEIARDGFRPWQIGFETTCGTADDDGQKDGAVRRLHEAQPDVQVELPVGEAFEPGNQLTAGATEKDR